MDTVRDLLRLTIGPLHYEFRARDTWGEDALMRLRAHVLGVDFAGPPDGVLHLADLDMTLEENQEINQDWLPDRFAALLPEDTPRQGWRLSGDETGHLTFQHENTHHGLWIYGAIPAEYRAPFQLPWPAVLEDIIAR